MGEVQGLQIGRSVAAREKKLAALRARGSHSAADLEATVADAQILGSLELSGVAVTWAEVHRRSSAPRAEVAALRQARSAVAAQDPFTVGALLTWHGATLGGGRLRTSERPPLGEGLAPPAPARFVRSRLDILEEWMGGESARELRPVEAAALVLARLVEILPFEDGNGRVSRLAASHLMVRGGMRPPILVGGDRERLYTSLRAALRLDTAPLAALLQEASDRSLDVMIQSLEGRG